MTTPASSLSQTHTPMTIIPTSLPNIPSSSSSSSLGGAAARGGSGGGGGGDCQASCCGNTQEYITNILHNSHQNTRGEIIGDLCLTILLDEMTITTATSSEENYTSTITQKPIEGGIAIPSSTLLKLNDEFDILEDVTDLDMIYGHEAVNEGKKADVDLIQPMKDLIRSIDEINLTKSSANGPITLLCEETLALLIRHYVQKAVAQVKTSSSKKKNKKTDQLSLVVPGYLSMKQRKTLFTASKSVGIEVRHIFSRGLATVAGNLIQPNSPLLVALKQWMSKCPDTEQDPLVVAIHSHSFGIDVAVIRCERNRSGDLEDGTNIMGFDRLICLASGGGPHEGYGLGSSNGADIKEKERLILSVITQQLSVAGVTNSTAVGAMIYSGSGSVKDLTHCLQSDDSSTLGKAFAKMPMFKSSEIDTVRGGSILTAAELESAKYYIEVEEDLSTIDYALSIGEDVVNYDVAYQLETSPTESSEPILIARKGTSIHKRYQGPVVKHRQNIPNILVSPLVIDGGSVNVVGSFTPKYSPGYPKLILLQKIPNYQNLDEENWIPMMPPIDVLKISSPPSSNAQDSESKDNIALKSTLTFSIADSTGTLKVENLQEESAKEKSEIRSQIFRVIFFFCLVVCLVVGYYGYGEYRKYSLHQQNVEWLTDFYSQHAPQKLQEDGFIEKTLRKYEGKLFLLWRQLEKTYKVKFSPPTTILEQVDDGF